MLRASVLCLLALGSLRGARASADDMDPALGRLRSGPPCRDTPSGTYCVEQELFERLASEYAIAIAPPALGPAQTLGVSRFGLMLSSTVTGIHASELYWQRGTEGGEGLVDSTLGRNRSPMPVLVWNRVALSKGLPYGLELGLELGQGMQTSIWTPGVALKWALIEGFRTRYGMLPDLAVQASVSRSVGSSQMTMELLTLDLSLSRPFVVSHTWTLSPFLGAQLVFTHVETGVIDLTPGTEEEPTADAFDACDPDPARAGSQSSTPGGEVCAGSGSDFGNSVVFRDIAQTRLRVTVGAEGRISLWRVRLALHYDLIEPEVPSASRASVASPSLRQLAFSLGLGAVL